MKPELRPRRSERATGGPLPDPAEPARATREVADHQRQLVGATLVWFAVAHVIATGVGLAMFPRDVLARLPWYLLAPIVVAVGWAGLRAHRPRVVGWALVLALFGLLAAAASLHGGLWASALSGLPAVVCLAALVLGPWEGAAVAALAVAVVAVAWAGELFGWRAAHAPTAADVAATHVSTLVSVAAWSGLSMRWVRRSLAEAEQHRARAEHALAARDQELERRRAVEEELRIALAAANTANEAKSRFLANMSHELRTPLNAIIGYAEILMDELAPDADRTDLERIRGSGRHLLGLITDVLDLSKIEAGHLRLVPENIDLADLVAQVAADARPLVEGNANTFGVEVAGDLGSVYGDPVRIRQVLGNLLSNAAKFTRGGAVALAASREEGPDGGAILFHVRDTGIGIDPDHLPRLFRPFAQADDSTRRRFGGSGLGLALSLRLARMMEGDVTVDSTPGVGSTFTLRIPLRSTRREVAHLEEQRVAEARAGDRPSVLCVDDDPAALLLLDHLLEREGLVVVPCLQASRAVALAAELRPIAVTVDLYMPDLDGAELIQQLRADPRTVDLPTVVVSVDGDHGRALALGVQRWLTKPVDRATLVRTLADLGGVGSGPVLIVEDDAAVRDVLCRTLATQGIRTVQAHDGVEALAVLEEVRPTLVLLDLMMPEMDGFTLAERLKADPRHADLPIVVLTAASLDAEHRQRLAACAGILEKSEGTLGSLVDTLRRLGRLAPPGRVGERPVSASGRTPSSGPAGT